MRIKRVAVSVDLIRLLLAPNNVIPAARVVLDGWPEDARVIGMWPQDDTFDGAHQTLFLVVESASFDEAPNWKDAPFLNTTFDTQGDLVREQCETQLAHAV